MDRDKAKSWTEAASAPRPVWSTVQYGRRRQNSGRLAVRVEVPRWPDMVCDSPRLIVSSVRRKARARPSIADSGHPRRAPWKLTKGSTMLFGKRRGMLLTLALAIALGLGLVMASSARADGLLIRHSIPREVDAYDFTTGRPFMAPPVPYGHYAADYLGAAHKAAGCVTCQLHGLMGGGGGGHSLFHNGDGGCGHGDGGGSSGIGCGAGHGLFGHHGSESSDICGSDGGAGYATTWAQPSGQGVVIPSGQSICGQAGCDIGAKHSHLSHITGATGQCGDPGCSQGAGHGHGKGTVCGLCGGRGCANCLSKLTSGLHGRLASIAGVFVRPKISWFNGAGGPVPITPGYVPYIVTTRSPRDFFSFAPMNPNAQ
jgi:hypothetical protein